MPFPLRKICFLQCFSVQVSRMSTRAISAFIGDKGSAIPPVQVATIFLATTRACTDLFIAPLLSRDSHSVSPPPSSHLRKVLCLPAGHFRPFFVQHASPSTDVGSFSCCPHFFLHSSPPVHLSLPSRSS